MATMRTTGTRVLNTQIDAELRDYLDKYVRSRNETYRKVVERSLRNEFKNPPPLPSVEPLPPIPEPANPKPRRRK